MSLISMGGRGLLICFLRDGKTRTTDANQKINKKVL